MSDHSVPRLFLLPLLLKLSLIVAFLVLFGPTFVSAEARSVEDLAAAEASGDSSLMASEELEALVEAHFEIELSRKRWCGGAKKRHACWVNCIFWLPCVIRCCEFAERTASTQME